MVLYSRGFIISCLIPSFIAIQAQSHRGQNDFFVHAGAISQASVSHRGVSPPRSCTGYSDCVQDLPCELTKYDSQLRAQKSLSLALGPNRLSSGRNLGNSLRPLNHVTELKRKKKA